MTVKAWSEAHKGHVIPRRRAETKWSVDVGVVCITHGCIKEPKNEMIM